MDTITPSPAPWSTTNNAMSSYRPRIIFRSISRHVHADPSQSSHPRRWTQSASIDCTSPLTDEFICLVVLQTGVFSCSARGISFNTSQRCTLEKHRKDELPEKTGPHTCHSVRTVTLFYMWRLHRNVRFYLISQRSHISSIVSIVTTDYTHSVSELAHLLVIPLHVWVSPSNTTLIVTWSVGWLAVMVGRHSLSIKTGELLVKMHLSVLCTRRSLIAGTGNWVTDVQSRKTLYGLEHSCYWRKEEW